MNEHATLDNLVSNARRQVAQMRETASKVVHNALQSAKNQQTGNYETCSSENCGNLALNNQVYYDHEKSESKQISQNTKTLLEFLHQTNLKLKHCKASKLMSTSDISDQTLDSNKRGFENPYTCSTP
ncbi:uncharacterized protein CMU_024630 [Cryptosporidium muris RN66]|uniref:Uncharacterized protein n=1 Tax=Cryptosporidium muris (strain RN66) TaxID=441375 RepID=B6AAQ5_CRYMR|nr:uncharacterized protein CMU_024630 [Cryptosporidium muris RN66]EEA05457.1 hypothetical protein CMU_024630 [Cryptosporidium muris RN66]|eukprot:XP_002139806.1 hypothetical protein [Cryptosporidium muris RN66]